MNDANDVGVIGSDNVDVVGRDRDGLVVLRALVVVVRGVEEHAFVAGRVIHAQEVCRAATGCRERAERAPHFLAGEAHRRRRLGVVKSTDLVRHVARCAGEAEQHFPARAGQEEPARGGRLDGTHPG